MNNAILVITVFVLLLQINIASAQSTWVRMYGGSNQDIAASMTMGKDGSLIATGSTYSNDGDFNILNKGQNDIIFLKFNNAGNIIVKKTFGGKYVTDEVCPDGWTETLPISHLQLLLEEKFIDKIHST
jgi:hypothetical protein